jgi:DnaJ family protein B protein 12
VYVARRADEGRWGAHANREVVVSRAFQVLSDPDKKAKFDRFGGDPDNRFPGASSSGGGASPFSNFARSSGGGGRQGGPMFEEEMSPEEMFRQFFGGAGPFGGAFGTSARHRRFREFMARDGI